MNDIKISDKVQLDEPTKKWFEKQPDYMVTTVRQCKECGLFYKPSLGHKCKKDGVSNETD